MSVNLSPVGGAGAQFCDNNGNPLNGGKLYTYSAGTTTPAATYTSAAGVTFHPNPIILNAGGRVPDSGEIWLSDNISYKFVLKTSADVLIATWDNINGINSNFVNYTIQEEVITATAGQTVFDLTTITYAPATNSLTVYVDGVNQIVNDAYLETDTNTVTFTAGLHVGALVKFTTAVPATGTATDASVVSYTPPFTGGVSTTVENKLAQTVSVKDFGATGNGGTDDTAAIQAAVDSGATAIYFPRGTYLVTETIAVPNTVKSMYGDGSKSSVIQGSGSAFVKGIVTWTGSGFTTISSLASNTTEGLNTLTFSSSMSSTLSAGDVIAIFNPTASSYSSARTYYYAGEMAQVYSVSGTAVEATAPIQATYVAADVQLTKLTGPATGLMTGLAIRGDGTNNDSWACMNIRYGKDIVVENCLFENAHYAGLSIEQSYNIKVTHSELNCIVDPATVSGLQYGCVVVNSNVITVDNCTGTSERHCFSTGGLTTTGATDPRVVNRDILVHGCVFRGYSQYSLDAHGNTEGFEYTNNTLHGGVNFGGNKGVISNNRIMSLSDGHGIFTADLKGADLIISDNDITVYATSNRTGIYVNYSASTVTSGTSRIVDNRVNHLQISGTNTVVAGVVVQTSGGNTTIITAEVADNVITCDTNHDYGIYVYGGGVTTSNLSGRVADNKITGATIYCDYIQSMEVIDNYVDCNGGLTGRNGITITARDGSPILICKNNFVRLAASDCIRMVSVAPATSTYMVCSGNTVSLPSQVDAGRYGINVIPVATSIVEYANNTVMDTSANDQVVSNGVARRLEATGSTTIASATALDLADFPYGFFTVSGTTNITSIASSVTRPVGNQITLKFSDSLTVTDGSNLKLAGNFTTTADDTLTLQFDGTNWVEISRSAN